MTRRARAVAGAWLLAAAATAQQATPPSPPPSSPSPPATLAAVQRLRTYAIGGTCDQLLLQRDGRHLLSIGELGDLVWWDVATRRPVRHVPAIAPYVAAAALHPSAPWAAIAWSPGDFENNAVWGVDLTNGTTTRLAEGHASDLCIDAFGHSMAARYTTEFGQQFAVYDLAAARRGEPTAERWRSGWRRHGTTRPGLMVAPWPERVLATARSPQLPDQARHARSPRGVRHVTRAQVRARANRPANEPGAIDCAQTWIEPFTIADDGTIFAADLQGQVHVFALDADEPPVVHAPHHGAAHALVWSPDSRFLAIAGLGGVRIVDRNGVEVLAVAGTTSVAAGSAGSDFVLFGRAGARHVSASTGRDPRPLQPWPDEAPMRLRDSEHEVRRMLDPTGGLRPGLHALWTLAPALVRGSTLWLAPTGTNGAKLVQGTAAGWTTLATGPGVVPVALQPVGDGDEVLELNGNIRNQDVFAPGGGWLQRFAPTGERRDLWNLDNVPSWLVQPRPGLAWVGTAGTQVFVIDTEGRAAIRAHTTKMPWLDAAPWRDGCVIANDGHRLLVVDVDFVTRATIALPGDVAQIDVVAVAPDRRHVAIADDGDVRVLQVD